MPDPRGIVNVLTVDVEEYYHGLDFAAALGPAGIRRLPSRVVIETQRLLEVLADTGTRATFFTLGTVARRHPRLVRDIVHRGHELASHGWDHRLVSSQDARRFRQDVRAAKHALEQAAGREVVGYRAPNYSITAETPWAFTVLAEEGYVYDSSIHPIVHDRYGLPDAPRFPYRLPVPAGLEFWEIPVGTARLAGTNVPLGGGFFRLFPLAFIRAGIASVNRREGRPVVLYVHPWELDPHQPRPPMSWRHRFRHYVGLERAERKLRGLLGTVAFTSVERAFADLVRPTRVAASAG